MNAWHDSTARVMRELLAALFSQDVTLVRRCVRRAARRLNPGDAMGEAAFVAMCGLGFVLMLIGGAP